MTIGYPDFQSYAQWVGAGQNFPNEPISNSTSFKADIQLGNFASMWLSTGAGAFGINVLVQYYTDSTKTQGLGSYSWGVQAVTGLTVAVPNLGPFAEITLSMTQTGSQNVGLIVIPLNTPLPRPVYPRQGNKTSFSGSIVASGSQTFNLPQTMEGVLYATFVPSDTTGKLTFNVNEVSIAGALAIPIIQSAGLTAATYFVAATSTAPVQVTITNTDGTTTHSLLCRVQVVPGL